MPDATQARDRSQQPSWRVSAANLVVWLALFALLVFLGGENHEPG